MPYEQANAVSQHIELLSAAFSCAESQSSGRMYFFLISGVVSTILGAALTYCVGRLKERRYSKQQTASNFLEILMRFEDRCLDYWSKDNDPQKDMIDEARIKAGYRQLRQYSEIVDIGLDEKQKKKLQKLTSQLFEAATGEEFESGRRKASRGQAQRIAHICSRIAPILLEKSSNP